MEQTPAAWKWPVAVFLIAIGLVLILTSCGANITPAKQIAISCQGYASTLSTLAVAKRRGQLTPEQIATVDELRPGLNSVCLHGDYSHPMADRQAIEDALYRLAGIEGALP